VTGSLLRIYVHANGRQRRNTVWWSLLRHARESGVQGGSAFRAMAGFGRHHTVNFGKDLRGFCALAMEVEFLVTDAQARELLDWAQRKHIRVFYTLTPIEFGADPPADTGTVAAALTEAPERCLSFYVRESDRHGRVRLYRWLLRQALSLGLPGGTATETVAGFGRHRLLHDAELVDLAVNLAVRVDFLVTGADAQRLLRSVREAHPDIVFHMCPARTGFTVEELSAREAPRQDSPVACG